jgi:hypothetical protein
MKAANADHAKVSALTSTPLRELPCMLKPAQMVSSGIVSLSRGYVIFQVEYRAVGWKSRGRHAERLDEPCPEVDLRSRAGDDHYSALELHHMDLSLWGQGGDLVDPQCAFKHKRFLTLSLVIVNSQWSALTPRWRRICFSPLPRA